MAFVKRRLRQVEADERGIELVFTNLKSPVRDILRQRGLWDRRGPDRLHAINHQAVRHMMTD